VSVPQGVQFRNGGVQERSVINASLSLHNAPVVGIMGQGQLH